MVDTARRIEFSEHARARMRERGATEPEVTKTIREGERKAAKRGRWAYSATFEHVDSGAAQQYVGRRISAIVVEEPERDVVVTVFVFYLTGGGEP